MSLSQVVPIRPNTRIEFALIHEANHRVANHLTLLAGMVQVQASNVAKGPELVSRDEVQAILREVAGKVIGIGQLHRKLSDLPHDKAIDLGDYLIESSHALVKMLAPQARIGTWHAACDKLLLPSCARDCVPGQRGPSRHGRPERASAPD